MGDVDINTLAMKQYLALTRKGVVKPEIRNNVNFEIKSQLMRDLREDTFLGNKNDDAHEHVEMVLDIVSLFSIVGVSHDVIRLRIFPIPLTGLLRDGLIGSPWERSTLGIYLRKLSSKGIVHHPRPPNSLKRSITSSKKAMKHCTKLEKGCGLCRGTHLDKECPFNEEVKGVEEKLRELRRSSMVSLEDILLKMAKTELDLVVSVNIMPHSMFKSLKLTNLKETTMLVEMADMSKKAHMGKVENVLVKIDRFLFLGDFVAVDMKGD
nr:hypothetical protein [Tanacetum cinerariifolium]